jgi:integrase
MATVRKRILPSGKGVWQADYRDGSGARRSKQFSLKKEAEAFLVKAQHDVGQGTHVADSASITVADAAELWYTRARNEGLERSTLDQYRQHKDLHIIPEIGSLKLNIIAAPAVQGFADRLAKTRSRAMVRKVLVSLSGIFSEAQRVGKAANNPVSAVRVRVSKREKGRVEMPSKAELRAILKATPDKHKPFIFTAAFTGMRSSELRGLAWADVDLEKAVVTVRRRADKYNRVGPPKSEAGTRDIPLAPMVVKTLKEWKKTCPKGELDLVFPTGSGGVENHGNLLNRVFWPIQVAAGVSTDTGKKNDEGSPIMDAKYSLHALRHAAAALWIEQGWQAKKIQAVMGHSTITMTFDQYGFLFPSEEDDAAGMKAIEDRLLAD